MNKMSRWLVGIVVAAGLFFGVKSALKAQLQTGGPNYVQQLSAYIIGAPQVNLNSSGSNFGQIGNPSGSNESSQWYIGYGSTLSAIGTQVLNWTTSAQVLINAASDAILSQNVFQINAPVANKGVYYLAYLSNGWLEFHAQQAISGQIAASVPTISGCGSSPSAATGTDMAGDVSVGGSPANGCVVSFNSLPDNIPHCICNDDTTQIAGGCIVGSESRNGFTMFGGDALAYGAGKDVFQAADRLSWQCFSNQ